MLRNNIFLAAGGTGGHIFPAVAVAKKLVDEKYNICIISDESYLKYNLYGLNHRIIPTGKTLKTFTDIKNIFLGFIKTIGLISELKPNLVVGFGGYPTLPVLLACVFTRTPFILHEQNAYVGKVNKFFARFSKKLLVSYHETYGLYFRDMEKIIYTGSPIRESIRQLYNVSYKYPSKNEKFTVLITGGSGGARIFSEYLPKIFNDKYYEEQKNIKLYHQVRPEYVSHVREYYSCLGIEAYVESFFENIEELLKKAHLVIGRAGSGTINEIAIAGRPSILIPLSSRGNNRQVDNAKTMANNKAGIVVLENNFTIENFQNLFFKVIKDKNLLIDMSSRVKELAVINADENIFNVIKNIVENEK